jgi:hypothetical protein
MGREVSCPLTGGGKASDMVWWIQGGGEVPGLKENY